MVINLPPPCQPCRPSCLFCLLNVTACIQANTRGMLIMPVHDIFKISPPVLSQQSIGCMCQPLHLGLLAHPAQRYAIFRLGDWEASAPFTFCRFSWEVMGFLCLQDKWTTGSCALSAGGYRRRNMQEFVARVTQWQGNPRARKPLCVNLLLDIVYIYVFFPT